MLEGEVAFVVYVPKTALGINIRSCRSHFRSKLQRRHWELVEV